MGLVGLVREALALGEEVGDALPEEGIEVCFHGLSLVGIRQNGDQDAIRQATVEGGQRGGPRRTHDPGQPERGPRGGEGVEQRLEAGTGVHSGEDGIM
jgi:hypothetical protein